MYYSISPKGYELIARAGTHFLKEEGDRPFTVEMAVLEFLNNADAHRMYRVTETDIISYVVEYLEFPMNDTIKAIKSLSKRGIIEENMEISDVRDIINHVKDTE